MKIGTRISSMFKLFLIVKNVVSEASHIEDLCCLQKVTSTGNFLQK